MKKVCLSFLLGLIVFTYVSAQPDLQWIILNGQGKDGVNTPTRPEPIQNNYTHSIDHLTGNAQFTINGYAHPQSDIGKNNLFVIFSDGSYFDSRFMNKSEFFSPPTPPTGTSHTFSYPRGKNIKALYTTRNYEGDDPPENIVVRNGNPSSNTVIHPIPESPRDRILKANHAVLRSRDITLILDIDSLRFKYGNNGACTLRYDKLRNIKTNEISRHNCFSPESIFYDSQFNTYSHCFPSNAYQSVQDSHYVIVPLNTSNKFLFINLRPTPDINDYYHDEEGNHLYNAVFEIIYQNVVRHTYQENLLDAYDPNLILLESVHTSSKTKNSFANYYIEFENTGTWPVKEISLKIEFPEDIDLSCIPVGTWHIGSQSGDISVSIQNQEIEIKLMGAYTLFGCGSIDTVSVAGAGGNAKKCIGSILLTAKVSDFINDVDIWGKSNLLPENCIVYFKDNPTPLEIVTKMEVLIPNPFGSAKSIMLKRPVLHGSGKDICNINQSIKK